MIPPGQSPGCVQDAPASQIDYPTVSGTTCEGEWREANSEGERYVPLASGSNGMKESEMRRMFGFMIGIMVGVLVGSTVALLLAPRSGERFRDELRTRGEGFLADIRRAAEARRAELTERLASLRAPRERSIQSP